MLHNINRIITALALLAASPHRTEADTANE